MLTKNNYSIGQWCWHVRYVTSCQIIEIQDLWGSKVYRAWLPAKNAVVRALTQDLASLASLQPTVEQILYSATATKL